MCIKVIRTEGPHSQLCLMFMHQMPQALTLTHHLVYRQELDQGTWLFRTLLDNSLIDFGPCSTILIQFGLFCLFGLVYLDSSLWSCLFGPVYLVLSILTCLLGPIYLDQSSCVGPVYSCIVQLGHVSLDPSIWPCVFGSVYLDPSIQARLFGIVFLDLSV